MRKPSGTPENAALRLDGFLGGTVRNKRQRQPVYTADSSRRLFEASGHDRNLRRGIGSSEVRHADGRGVAAFRSPDPDCSTFPVTKAIYRTG